MTPLDQDHQPGHVAELPLNTAGILLPSPVCSSGSNRKQMQNDVKFYNQPSAGREDWYRLVIPDDEADPFIEHTWTYRNADGSMEMNSGRACIAISDFPPRNTRRTQKRISVSFWPPWLQESPIPAQSQNRFTAARGTLVFCRHNSLSPTTPSNLGFALSPRVRSSKIVMRNPLRRLHPWHRRAVGACTMGLVPSERDPFSLYQGDNRPRRCRSPGSAVTAS